GGGGVGGRDPAHVLLGAAAAAGRGRAPAGQGPRRPPGREPGAGAGGHRNHLRGVMDMRKSTVTTKIGLAEMLKGGVIMDVVNPDQARIAEDAGAVAVMALERVPAEVPRH